MAGTVKTRSSRATLAAVAEQAGLSIRTVSRILTGTGECHAPATSDRVRRLAARLGYVPNATARAMRSGRFGALALLLSSDANRSYLPPELLAGIQDELRRHDLHLTMSSVSDEQLSEGPSLPKFLRQQLADGLLVNYTHRVPAALDRLVRRLTMPVVWINNAKESDAVCFDDRGAARVLTDHLLALGHRRIAYADFHNDGSELERHFSAVDRRRGYEEAMRAAGREPRVAMTDRPFRDADRLAAATALLAGPDRPTAVIGYSPGRCALPLYLTATVRLRLRVPGDLSLCTFSPLAEDELGFVPTKMRLPEHDLGREAVAMVLRKVSAPDAPSPSLRLAARLVEGESTSPPTTP